MNILHIVADDNYNENSNLDHVTNPNRDIINILVNDVDPMDKIVCKEDSFSYPECKNHPCPGGIRNIPDICCSDNYDYKCLRDEISVEDSEFRKTSE